MPWPYRLYLLISFSFFIAIGTPAAAQSAPIPVVGNVVDGCAVAADPLHFGVIVGTTGAARSSSTITVRCNADADFTVTIDRGLHNQGVNRRMRNPATGAFMRYRLYSDPGYSRQWGDRRNQSVSANSGPSGDASLTVYGEIADLDATASGTYSDLVTVTVEF